MMILLTECETQKAFVFYEQGWTFQQITEKVLEARNAKIRRDMLREVGVVLSKKFQRQMYPVEFYGKVEEYET